MSTTDTFLAVFLGSALLLGLYSQSLVPWGALACKGFGIFCQQGGAP